MNLKLESKDSPEQENISKLFLEYNAIKYSHLLSRFRPDFRNHIKTIPLFFHVNLNLLPGYVNNKVPHTVYNYLPDTEAVDHARSFNSKFSYDINTPAESHSIEAIYIQDNLKSGKIILWIIYNSELEDSSVDLLKEKALRVGKWLDSKKIKMECHVATPADMPLAYWGDKYNSIHPDKSIFLDDFYSENILLAGKSPAWWLVPPDNETQYEQSLNEIKIKNSDKFNDIIDFGPIANARPQDYLATALINLINIKSCPEETWLNILDLCHKLASFPSFDCTSFRIKKQIYSASSTDIHYKDIYCNAINETIDAIYGRGKTILLTRILKLIAFKHKADFFSVNIYRNLLSDRQDNGGQLVFDEKFALEFIPATEIIFDLIKEAFQWFIKLIKKTDCNLLMPGSMLDTITQNLIHRIDIKDNYIPVTNAHTIKTTTPYDICFKRNTEIHKKQWSIYAIDNESREIEVRQGDTPIALAAWAVFNRLIDDKTRISVSCPYLSVKQTLVADIISILLDQLPVALAPEVSLDTLTKPESPSNDILIINAHRAMHTGLANEIHIYRFSATNYGEIIFSEYKNMDGFMTYVCESLGADLKAGNMPHNISIHSINNGLGNAFTSEARLIYAKARKFFFGSRIKYTHFFDYANDHYYAITRHGEKLTAYTDIRNHYPEDYFQYSNEYVLMNFSDDIQDHKVLNYVYRNNVYEYLQVFYLIQDNDAHIYILDENGILTRFSQPFFDRQNFLNQWLMFLYNTCNRIKSLTENTHNLPNIEICELTYKYNDLLVKTHLNSSMLPKDSRYFDLKIAIRGEKGSQSITLKCEDIELTSEKHGKAIYKALRTYLSQHFKSGLNNPVYLTDVDAPLWQFNIVESKDLHIRDYIKFKINIEHRLNAIINQS